MVEPAHDLNLIDERLLAIFLAVGALLGKRLHCILLVVLVLHHQVHRCKVPLPDLLYRLEQLVEPPLVDASSQRISPRNQIALALAVPEGERVLKLLQFEPVRPAQLLLVVFLSQEFEDEVEGEVSPHELFLVGFLDRGGSTLNLKTMQRSCR